MATETKSPGVQIPEPPDPPSAPWGIWEKRINWIVTIIVALAMAAYALVQVTPPKAPGQPQVPAVAPAPDVVAPASLDVSQPADAPTVKPTSMLTKIGAVGVLAVQGVLSPDCSGAQQNQWGEFGTGLAGCLLTTCGLGQDLVQGLTGGGWQGIGMSALGCLIGCASASGVQVLAQATPAPAGLVAHVASATVQVRFVKP